MVEFTHFSSVAVPNILYDGIHAAIHRTIQSSIMTDDILNEIITHTNELNNWTQTVFVIHDSVVIDISSAANGKLSTIPVEAPINLQFECPNDSKYRFDSLQFKGLDQLKSTKHLILSPLFCRGCKIVASHYKSASPHCQGTWHFACSKHHVSQTDNMNVFSQGHMSMNNIKQQTLKQKKLSGSTHDSVKGIYSHKTRLDLVVQCKVKDIPKKPQPPLLNKRMLTN
jgi:hypothetical protein